MTQTLLEWLEDFVIQIEDPEKPEGHWINSHQSGWADGAYETQIEIARKLRYAVDVEKKRLKDEIQD